MSNGGTVPIINWKGGTGSLATSYPFRPVEVDCTECFGKPYRDTPRNKCDTCANTGLMQIPWIEVMGSAVSMIRKDIDP